MPPEIIRGQYLNEIYYNYNCFAYALDLHNCQAVKDFTIKARDKGYQDIYPSSEFIHHLLNELEGFLIETNQMANSEPCYAIYFCREWPKHAGKFRSEKVVSKWGVGHIWEHHIFEIPESYGDDVRFYRVRPPNLLADAFFAWAKSRLER